MASSVCSRTMQKAVALAGGRKQLARRLRAPLAELEKWIAGSVEPPKAIFLEAVDLVLEETSPPPAKSLGLVRPDHAGA